MSAYHVHRIGGGPGKARDLLAPKPVRNQLSHSDKTLRNRGARKDFRAPAPLPVRTALTVRVVPIAFVPRKEHAE